MVPASSSLTPSLRARRDGKMEIIVGTSMGFLYVLSNEGDPLPGWPILVCVYVCVCDLCAS